MKREWKWKASCGEERVCKGPELNARECTCPCCRSRREAGGLGTGPERCTVARSRRIWVPRGRRFLKAVGSLSGFGQEMEAVRSAFGKGYSGVLVESG